MTSHRLDIVCRSFWPDSGNVELAAGGLARELHRAGHQVHVVTSQWSPSHAETFEFLEVPVARVPRFATGMWANKRFVNRLTQTITTKHSDWDSLIVFGGSEELDAAIRAIRQKPQGQLTVVVDDVWLHRNRSQSGTRRKTSGWLTDVHRIVCTESWHRDEYDRLFPGSRPVVETIPTGVSSINCDAAERQAVRLAIGEVHPLLMLSPTDLVGICAPNFRDLADLQDLVFAWKKIATRFSNAKLWLIGDGPNTRNIWQQINELNLVDRVVLAGSFDNELDPYLACDFYVDPFCTPNNIDGACRAASCGLPVVTRSREMPGWLRPGVERIQSENLELPSLIAAIESVLESRTLRQTIGAAAQSSVRTHRNWSTVLEQWFSRAPATKSLRSES